MFIVKIISKRTGSVGWLSSEATPRDHKTEAGRFATRELAQAAFDEFCESIRRVTGHCRWTPEIVPL